MNATEKFDREFKHSLNEAIQAQVPLDHLVLMMDTAHHELLMLRQAIHAQAAARHQAAGIVAAHQMPNGRAIKPNGA